jgi:hypothetical protein
MRSTSPVVYLGPTLAYERARKLLPGALFRDPVRRGDLYRDRSVSAGPLVIIDGVFHQENSVSPREIRDVLANGAVVIGSASLGAMRAAECWPAGMRGVGTIFRLFRRGCLQSDDEVAVTFAAGGRQASVPLVNVRYAARALLRRGRIRPAEARRLIGAAERLHYADRYWRTILAGARLDQQLEAELAAFDLKQRDAIRCLEHVRTLPVPEQPSRASTGELLTRALALREVRFEAPERRATAPERDAFLRFWLATGGFARLTPERRKVLLGELGLKANRDQVAELEELLACRERDASAVAEALLHALDDTQLDRESLRWAAVRAGSARASGTVTTAQRLEAELALAAEFGCESYFELQTRARAASTRRALESTRDLLGLAIAGRDASFAVAPQARAGGREQRRKPLRSR